MVSKASPSFYCLSFLQRPFQFCITVLELSCASQAVTSLYLLLMSACSCLTCRLFYAVPAALLRCHAVTSAQSRLQCGVPVLYSLCLIKEKYTQAHEHMHRHGQINNMEFHMGLRRIIALERSSSSIFWFTLVFGPYPVCSVFACGSVPRNHSWWVWGTLWDARIKPRSACLQGQHSYLLCYCSGPFLCVCFCFGASPGCELRDHSW